MTFSQTAARLGAVAAAAVVALAGLTIWLVLTDPVAVAGAVGDGDVGALVLAIAKAVCRSLVRLAFGR